VLIENGAAKVLRSYPQETLGISYSWGLLTESQGNFGSKVAMGSMTHTIDISHFGSTFGCIRKHRTTIAATCALLFTTLVLLPVYLVLGQRQQKIDLRRLDSSYQVFCSQVNTMQEAHLPIQSRRCCSLVTPSTAAADRCTYCTHVCWLVHEIESAFVMQCAHEDGRAETRICLFDNIILYQGRLSYLYSGN